MTLQHHPHQLLEIPLVSLPRYSALSLSSSYSVTVFPTLTLFLTFFFTTPPIPSISCLKYPGFSSSNPSPAISSSAISVACVGLVDDEDDDDLEDDDLAASPAPQSISTSMSLAARQYSPRPHLTPSFPSPIPVPSPPR